MSHNNSRDFGGSGIFGSNSNVDDSQSQYNQNNNNNNNNNNDNLSFQPSVRGVTNDQYYERSLIPTTVKQILLSPDPEPDESFKIDGKPVHQVSIIGYLRSISPQSTHTVFEIDDQCSYKTPNGWIKCKLWSSDNDDLKQMEQEELKINDMVKIIGKIDTFRNLRSINIHNIQKITDKNEVYQHYIEAIMAHELNELLMNQHIPSYQQQFNQYMELSQNQHQADKQRYNQYKQQQQQQQQHNNNNNSNNYESQPHFGHNNNNKNNKNNNYNNNRNHNNNNKNNNNNYSFDDDERNLNQLQRNILNWLRSNDTNHDSIGHSRAAIKQGVNCYNINSVNAAIKQLYDRGFIQDTIEDNFRVVREEKEN